MDALPYFLVLAVLAIGVVALLADRARLKRQLAELEARLAALARESSPAVRSEAPAPSFLPSRPADPALLDHGRIEELRALGRRTGRDLLASLAALFRQSSGEQLAELRRSFAAGEAAAAQRAAHTLKSSAGNVGAKEIAELARSVEEFARGQQLDEARPLLARLESELPRVVDELERIGSGR